MYTISGLVLTGGHSTRMGQDKAFLKLYDKSFLDVILTSLSIFPSNYISCNKGQSSKLSSYNLITDEYESIGPIGGLYSGLHSIKSDYIFVCSCDTPLISSSFIEFICSYISSDFDVYVPIDRSKRAHPLCSLYSKKCLNLLREQIEKGNYKLWNSLNLLKVKYIDISNTVFQDEELSNINTKLQYGEIFSKKSYPRVLAISGVKNSGKTTLITKLIPLLKEKGLRVATIKHDGHDFKADTPNTDTYKHLEAGAYGTSAFSNTKYMLIKNQPFISEAMLIEEFSEVDLILLEGFKYSSYKKIEIVRFKNSSAPVGDPKTIIALATDGPTSFEGRVIDLNNIYIIADLIINYTKGGVDLAR
ncbi:molybdopterin-guanine dinucleotide biosynthesis protein B [Clostridium lacusfryxellense]|uniref:molybdopterin-guanine dinucleotide biosynthesis protein B n=1 Tax=Clostridium lacusfryxellense TaxID=205328 RepID=UPI001C0DF354|nr:molybdopterin-guanine dinucleotide biosynthesis protein B [Clostridium lacusfryxellense]MBU3112621.1 molybdopterin-guanine dinucleotide biosynthesis protein B [Clostridium lacusfryxellense]